MSIIREGEKLRLRTTGELRKRIIDAIALEPNNVTLKYPADLFRNTGGAYDKQQEVDPELAVKNKLVYAMLMAKLIDTGDVYRVVGKEITPVYLDDTPPLPLKGPSSQIELSDFMVSIITGQFPPEGYTDRKRVQSSMQTRLLRAANFWRTYEGVNSIVIVENGEVFPSTVSGIDRVYQSRGFTGFTINGNKVDVQMPMVTRETSH